MLRFSQSVGVYVSAGALLGGSGAPESRQR